MYRLVSAIDLSPGCPSVLIPIFHAAASNVPYVQSTNSRMIIEDFLPFYSMDCYDTIQVTEPLEGFTGRSSIIVVREPSGRIRPLYTSDLSQYFDCHEADIVDAPLLQMQIIRILGKKQGSKYDTMSRVAHQCFSASEQRSLWLNAALELDQKNASIWKAIDANRRAARINKIVFDREYFISLNYEEAFIFLSSHRHISYWDRLWFLLLERHPADERLLELAKNWIFLKFSPGENLSDAANVFCATVDRMIYIGYSDGDFADFLREHANSMLFFSDDFKLSHEMKRRLFRIIRNHTDSGDYTRLILEIIDSSFFNQEDTLLLIKELDDSLQCDRPELSTKEIMSVMKSMPKIDQYKTQQSHRPVLASLKRSLRWLGY